MSSDSDKKGGKKVGSTQQTKMTRCLHHRDCTVSVSEMGGGVGGGGAEEVEMKTKLRGGERSEGKVKRQGDEGGGKRRERDV